MSRRLIAPRWEDLQNDNVRAGACAVLAVLQMLATSTNSLTGGPGIGAPAPPSLTAQLQPPGVFFAVWALLYTGVLAFAAWQWRYRETELARTTSAPAALGFLVLMLWAVLASGSRTPNAPVVQVSLLLIILPVDAFIFLAVRAASAPTSLTPSELLFCAAPLSLLLGWLCVATVLLLSIVAQLCGAVQLSAASSDQAAPAALVAALAGGAAWLLSPVGPLPGNFFVAGTLCYGLCGSAVAGQRAHKPLVEASAVAAVVLIAAAAAAGTQRPGKWGWLSTAVLWLRAAVRGGALDAEAQPLVSS